ncbi:hypothetical protein GCK32_008377 [Trichostrongylus colubriformis]|uniref:Uncharacterized protein n=1 Tax=Trichostrongylus colubriformis TaxID=6319 RepID=A0AAN8IGT0_TRICO
MFTSYVRALRRLQSHDLLSPRVALSRLALVACSPPSAAFSIAFHIHRRTLDHSLWAVTSLTADSEAARGGHPVYKRRRLALLKIRSACLVCSSGLPLLFFGALHSCGFCLLGTIRLS